MVWEEAFYHGVAGSIPYNTHIIYNNYLSQVYEKNRGIIRCGNCHTMFHCGSAPDPKSVKDCIPYIIHKENPHINIGLINKIPPT